MIKSGLKLTTFLSAVLLLSLPANSYAESIAEFQSHLKLNETGVINVEETIVFDTEGEQRHGIIRNIKNVFVNDEGKSFRTPIIITGVTNERGQLYQYTSNQSGNEIVLRVGDPNRTFSGIRTFVLEYTFTGGVEEFSDHDEIYHNITGNNWSFPIKQATAILEFPQNFSDKDIDIYCYTGVSGSTQQNCTIEQNANTFTIISDQPLGPGEGITVSASFDKGLVTVIPKEPIGSLQSANSVNISQETVRDVFPYYLLWLFGPPVLIAAYFIKKGRDPHTGITSIPPLFEPPKDEGKRITPSEAGILEDERVDVRDLSATIVDLAIRGYLKIKEDGKDIVLTKSEAYKTKGSSPMEEFETELTDILFGDSQEVNVSDLSDSTKQKLFSYKASLYKDMVEKGFFPHNPEHVRAIWIVLGVFLIILGSFFGGIIALVLAYFMPRKTIKGARAKIDIMGLRKFLTSQTDQLEFQEKNWYLFEKLLPYAVAFGVTKTWASRFKDIKPMQETDWYEGRALNNAILFNSIANSLNSSVSAAVTPTRSSSGFSSGSFSGGGGGGFSGGGFSGGGGGGSW